MKRILTIFLIALFTITSFTNCFGKFGLTRKLYQIHDGINIGSGIVAKVFKTIIMYVLMIIPVYGVVVFIDIVIFNLIEFWTDSNPVGFNEFDKSGRFVKSIKKNNYEIRFTYSDFGHRLDLDMIGANESKTFTFLKNEPNKVYQLMNGSLIPIEIRHVELGSKLLIQAVSNGNLESSKMIDIKTYQELEKRYPNIH